MTSPFLTTNIFLINLAVLLLTTSLVGGLVNVLWLGIGNLLERTGFINIVFELLKLAVFFYCFPLVYIVLKIFEADLGRGYLFLPTKQILVYSTGFLVIWSLGILIMFVYMLHDVLKLKKKYADAFPCDRETQEIFETVMEKLHLRKHDKRVKLQLRQSYRAQVPFVTGILHPVVILPVAKYSREELMYILTHEVMHYKQGDILLKRVSIMVCAIHFFNPLVWLLLIEIQKWSEYACDYRVCQRNRKIQEYFEVLMNNAAGEGLRSRLASQLVENRHELVERAKKMKSVYGKTRSKTSAVIILCITFIISSVTVCATTFESAEQYVRLNQETVEEASVEANKQYVEHSEQGDAPEIQVIQGQVNSLTRSQIGFNWEVNSNSRVVGTYFDCPAGGMVAFSGTILPASVTVKIGVEDVTGAKTYVYGSGEVSQIFTISDAGKYRVFVENTSNTAVTVTGGYLIP